ncbi:MAG TPA: hypothetical protein VK824_00085, partial [Planctomycetota bacterium]|nr:hypothetical protein [Planctomycetota bacterium]
MRRRALCLALVALGVLVGLALRIAVAWHASGAGRDWEADGFVRCWEPSAFAPASRMRPPLVPWLFHGLAQVLDARSVLGVRLLSVAVSLIGLAGALVLARAIALRRAPREPLCGPGACAVTWCWALLPTLVAGAASPTGDALLGGLLCLAAAAALALPARPGVLRAALLALALLLVLLAGGIVAACAVVAALLVFLAPLPPLRAAAPPLLAVLAAC